MGLKLKKEPNLDDMANIEKIIEIYDNGHESIFYPDTHIVVERGKIRKHEEKDYCSFCGKKTVWRNSKNHKPKRHYFFIYCSECDLVKKVVVG